LALCLDPASLPGRGRILLAFSAGADSVCLAALLAECKISRPVLCVHIDHGLDAASSERAARAQAIAEGLGLAAQVIQVRPDPAHAGLEAGARKARYQALAGLMAPGDLLLTAHHADDQAETILMRLLRGSGPAGLSGIPACRTFGAGWLARPLLAFERQEIIAWLEAREMGWIEDPTNLDLSIDRNFLRRQVMPMLRRRWPGLDASIRRSGQLSLGAAQALESLAREDLGQGLNRHGGLWVEHLLRLSAYRQGEVIRLWCHRCGLEAPPGRQLEAFLDQLESSAHDRQPELRWQGHWLVRQGDAIWLFECEPLVPQDVLTWNGQSALHLPGQLGRLVLEGGPAFAQPMHVYFGQQAGERIRLPGRAHHHAVKQLMNEAGIPAWQRPLWPRLYGNDELLAVGDRWLSHDFAGWLAEHGARLCWHGPY
jgi:tRNA(Ile)-lysidine synthase